MNRHDESSNFSGNLYGGEPKWMDKMILVLSALVLGGAISIPVYLYFVFK